MLNKIAARLRAQANARRGHSSEHQLQNGASLTLTRTLVWALVIMRQGLSPHNDFGANGTTRRAAWENEIKTFRRVFQVPDNAAQSDYATELEYGVSLVWAPTAEEK